MALAMQTLSDLMVDHNGETIYGEPTGEQGVEQSCAGCRAL
jgi:hypothetical protein